MGLKDLFSFWRRGSKKKQHAVEAINSVEIQNEVVNRTGFGRKYEAGGTIDELPNAEGEFGRVKTNPIPVNASYGEVSYLSRLRIKETGQPVTFHRRGSCGTNHVCKNCVDLYEVISLDGSFRDELYFDMYHDGPSTKAPEGYILVEESEHITGVPGPVKAFPNGINDATSQYSKKVFGSDISLPGLRKIDHEKNLDSKEEKKTGKYSNIVDRPEESKEYLQSWSFTGKYLQEMFNKYDQEWADPHMGFCWLRTQITSPRFDSMNFRYKNQVFSVLMELVYKVADDAFLTKTTREMQRQQIKVCRKNDMIPCLFSIELNSMKPLHEGWNLYNTETGEPVIPMDIAGDSPRQVSSWELMNWGISIVMDELKKQGNKILSFTDVPEIMPQIWFEDEDGNKCWVQVVVNRPMEIVDLSGTILDEYKGYVAGVMISPLNGDKYVYRSRPANIKFMGMKEKTDRSSQMKIFAAHSENSKELESGNLVDLVDRARKNGNKITAAEIIEALQKQDISPEELDDIIVNKFAKNRVEVSFNGDESDED